MLTNASRLLLLLLFMILQLPASFVTTAQTLEGSVSAASLNVRREPAVSDDNVIAVLDGGTPVILEGRSADSRWLLISAQDGGIRGWVSAPYIRFVRSQLELLPISSATGEGPAAPEQPPAPAAVPPGAITATTSSTLNVRSAPQVAEGNVLAQIGAGVRVVVEGRNAAGDWVLVHSADNTVRGWIAARYARFSQRGALNTLPVIENSGSGLPDPSQVAAASEGAFTTTASPQLVMETPIFHNMTSSTVRAIFRRGQQLGNQRNVFMKVGDSVTATQPFMSGFGSGNYSLGPYGDLQGTIDFFLASPREGIENSFVYMGVAAVNGFVSGAVLDGTWSPEFCGRLVPLACSYDILRPSVAIVLFGGQDARLFDAAFFQSNLRRITKTLIDLGVIPVLNTFPMHHSFSPDKTILFNTVVINVANEYDVPLINLYRALQDLPEGGAKPEDPVHLTQGDTFYSFNGEERVYGVTLRNLLTLQALDILRREVLQ